MPFAITCPGCGKNYNLPANVQGKKVRCVQCRAEFIVGAAAPPQPPTEEFAEVELEQAPSFREELNKLTSAPSRSPAKTSPSPRRAQPQPQSTGSFLIPLVCICVFFAGSIFVAVVGGVALSFLVPIDEPMLAQNRPLRFDDGPRPPVDIGQPPLDVPPPDPFPNVRPLIEDGPRPGELQPPPPGFGLPRPPDPPPPPPEPELRPPVQPDPLKELPAPKDGGVALPGRPGQVNDLRFTALDTPGLLPCLSWSNDATRFYALEAKGRLRRIALKDFQEEKSLEIGRVATWLSQSAEGLVVTVERGEVWVIDPETLTVKNRWSVPTTRRVVSAPVLATAYAQTPDDSLTVLDLKNGQTRQYNRFDLRDGGSRHLIASPDGKHLFAQGGMEQLIRFRIDGTKISVVDRTERIAQNGQSVCVSPDGAYVCLPSGGGNYHIPAAPNINYGTYVFRTSDLKVPAFSLASGAYPRLVGFDSRAGLAFAQNHDTPLIVFTTNGVKQQEYRFGSTRQDPMQFLAHPEGKKLFVLTSGTLYWCELGVAAAPMPPIGPMPPFPPGRPPPRPGVTPDPKATNDILADVSRKVDDADVTSLRVLARELLEGMCWAADGKSFYCAERSGIVRRIAVNGLKEEARLDIGQSCYNMALSSEGPVVAVLENGGEVWLLDAGNLKVKRKVPVPTLTRVTAAPSSATAYALSMGAASEQVNVIDLKEGKVLKTIHKPDVGEAGFGKALVTPDGKYLFGVTNGTLHRFRVEKDRLIFEESGPKPNTPRTSSQPLGTDGRYIFMPLTPTPPSARNTTIPVYEVSNLQKPVANLELTFPLPTTVGFDPKGKAFYGSVREGTLTVFGADGQVKKKYALETSITRFARQIIVHPDGTRLVVATSSSVFWVELPK